MLNLNKRTTIYFRHWYPRIDTAFGKAVFANSTHYGVFWLGIIRYAKLA
jgi:hypothetical protein